ncbi:MAG TPA: hypothetical protein VLD37_07705 [Candidatus Bilamarchaeum sp.]|nr:hypothetical protein [Candidatus Bilamarchaeum sp.]
MPATVQKRISDSVKDKFRAALIAGSLLMPSAALANDPAPNQPPPQGSQAGSRGEEHRHPEAERFGPGPLFMLRGSAFRTEGNFHANSINPRAVVPFSAGTSFSMNDSRTTDAFHAYMLGRGSGDFSPRISSAGLSLRYDHLIFRGVATTTGMIEEARAFTGTGHAASVTPSLTVVSGHRGVPLELSVFGGFGFRNWGASAQFRSAAGETEALQRPMNEAYAGLYGFELRFPSVPCEGLAPFRVERIGTAAFGDISNLFAYVTFSGNYLSNHRARVRTLLTPHASNFADEAGVGGELIPADLTFYLRHGYVSVSPGARFDYNVPAQSLVLEAFGEVAYFPHHAIGFQAKAGWVGQIAGRRTEEGEPSSAFGSLNVIINTNL